MPDMELDALIDKINAASAQAAEAPPDANNFKEQVDNTGSQKTIEYIKSAMVSMAQKAGFDPKFGPTRPEKKTTTSSGFGATQTTTPSSGYGFGTGANFGYGYAAATVQKPKLSREEETAKYFADSNRCMWEDVVDNFEEKTTNIFDAMTPISDSDRRKAERKIKFYSEVNKAIKNLAICAARKEDRKEN